MDGYLGSHFEREIPVGLFLVMISLLKRVLGDYSLPPGSDWALLWGQEDLE